MTLTMLSSIVVLAGQLGIIDQNISKILYHSFLFQIVNLYPPIYIHIYISSTSVGSKKFHSIHKTAELLLLYAELSDLINLV